MNNIGTWHKVEEGRKEEGKEIPPLKRRTIQ
jgi:hypothetical protein